MATVYISQAGDASPNGSESRPRSITWFNVNASAGNTYIFMGDFTSAIIPPATGTLGSPIICEAHPTQGARFRRSGAANAINFSTARQYWEFDGLTLNAGTVDGPMTLLATGDYTGLKIRNCTFNSTARTSSEHLRATAGIYGDGIEITGNTFNDSFYDSVAIVQAAAGDLTNLTISNNTWNSCGRHALNINVSSAAGVCDSVYIENNELYGTGQYKGGTWSSNWTNADGIRVQRTTLSIGAKMTNVYVRYNKLRHVLGKGINIQNASRLFVNDNDLEEISRGVNGQGIGIYGCDTFEVNNNRIVNVYSTSSDFDGHGIDIDAPPDDVTDVVSYCENGEIAHNYIENTKAAADSPGINLISAVNIDVYSNVIVDARHGIRMTFQSDGTGAPHCQNNDIFNNVIVGRNHVDSESGIRYAYAPTAQAAAVNSNTVRNNLFINLASGLCIKQLGPDAATITAPTHNAFWLCAENYKNLDEAGGFANNTADDVLADPLHDTNYHLTPLSPLIAAGQFVAYKQDKQNTPFWNPPSIGAFEYIRPRGTITRQPRI